MQLVDTALPEVKIIEPKVFGDARGFFMETWHQQKFDALGLNLHFVQDNHSRSAKGILRGMHYQLTNPQGKLVRVTAGSVFDVAVDMRKSSPNFGKWVGVELSGENHRMLWVPPGFAHGFLVTSESADFVYKCTDFYSPEYEHSLLWNDPTVGIQWPLAAGQEPSLSGKDKVGKVLADAATFA